MKNIILAALLACSTLNLFGQVEGQTKGFKNPIIPGFHPDPSVCCVGEDFYLVTSSFNYFPGVPVFHSKDLVNWEQIGNVLDRESQVWLGYGNISLGIYAPTIRYNNGTYYMITTNVSKSAFGEKFGMDSRGNFICTAKDPAGPWSDPIWLDQGGIDPSLYFEDGKCYFCSNPNDQIFLCEINPETGEQLTPSVAICNGAGGRYPEAPHIYKKDGWYYLMLAEGGTEEAHSLTMFRSRNIYGPYNPNPANPILTNCKQAAQNNPIHGTGHGDIVQAPDGSWWLVGLAYRPQGNMGGTHHLTGRETYLAPVAWPENGWPVVNGNGTFNIDNDNVTTLPQHLFAQHAAKTDFRKQDLGFEWNYINNYHPANYIRNNKGLTLKAGKDPLDSGSTATPTFVGIRQSDIDCTVTTEMALLGNDASDAAGLTAYMTFAGHYDVVVRNNAQGKQEVALRYRVGSLRSDVKTAVLAKAGQNVYLRCTASPDFYAFSYSTDGKKWNDLGKLETKLLSTETQGGFTGLYFGLFADGKEGDEARFTSFEYDK